MKLMRMDEPLVVNGRAYDVASVDVTNYKTVVVPENATIRRTGISGEVVVYMEKGLGYHGHPVTLVSIDDVRMNMGFAMRVYSSSIALATYGEWDTQIEGGAGIRFIVEAGADIEIETAPGLAGFESQANNGYPWHERPAAVAEGWTMLEDSPDLEFTVKRHFEEIEKATENR